MNDSQNLIRAIRFAANAHRNQRRKDADASPYINHPIDLASILAVEGGVSDVVTLQAAILHDTIEDTNVTYEELVENFGKEVADVVVEVTDDKTLHFAERKRLQIEHATMASDRAKLVKMADKIANVRDLGQQPPTDWTPQRRQEYAAWAKQVVDRLRGVSPALDTAFDEAYVFVA